MAVGVGGDNSYTPISTTYTPSPFPSMILGFPPNSAKRTMHTLKMLNVIGFTTYSLFNQLIIDFPLKSEKTMRRWFLLRLRNL
jgi:hypothetical protein